MSNIVGYKRKNENEHLITIDSKALPDFHINYEGIPNEERGGTSVKLLGASCLYCFAATLGSALSARGVDIKSMTGTLEIEKGKDEVRRTKVTAMHILIEVEIDDKDAPVLDKCKKIMERGCLLTYTLEDAIEIEHKINRKSNRTS